MGEEYHYLLGAEDVKNAGYAMENAAAEMQRAAGSLEDSLYRHRQFMTEWLDRLETVLKENNK